MNRWEFRIILCTNEAVSDYGTCLCFHRGTSKMLARLSQQQRLLFCECL